MKKFFYAMAFLMASEDHIQEIPQPSLSLEQKQILEESKSQRDALRSPPSTFKGSIELQGSPSKAQIPVQLLDEQNWLYATAVITTTFLDGVIKRSYGILLRDGLYLTSANMVYNKNVYPRTSFAMMQDESSPPFICVAKLSLKALDLQRGLAVLDTAEYTDSYCNVRKKSFYHDRIYAKNWIDVFNRAQGEGKTLYSVSITPLNSFITQITPAQENLNRLAFEREGHFEGYNYPYGKGYYTKEGKLVGMIGADKDDQPRFVRTEEISEFLCELKEKKILQNQFLHLLCPQKEEKGD